MDPQVFLDYMSTSYLLSCLFTYLLTARSRVLIDQLTGSQLVKNFPSFYGTRMMITAFTSAPTCLYPEHTSSSSFSKHV